MKGAPLHNSRGRQGKICRGCSATELTESTKVFCIETLVELEFVQRKKPTSTIPVNSVARIRVGRFTPSFAQQFRFKKPQQIIKRLSRRVAFRVIIVQGKYRMGPEGNFVVIAPG